MEMESSSVSARSKRRRLISVPSSVSPQRPDLPAAFESLNDDTLSTILQFVGNKSYMSFGVLNKQCKAIYLATKGMTKKTFFYGYVPLSRITNEIKRVEQFNWKLRESVGKGVVCYNRRDVLDWALEDRHKFVLNGICNVAAEEGRFDILNEVLNNVEDESDAKGDIFGGVDTNVVESGKLNVIKWFVTNGLSIDETWCIELSAIFGQLHILQWLREEQGFKLYGDLYESVIVGCGLLHVLKWLREQACPWTEWTFMEAAYKGKLDILQWLHDEGCPWPEDRYCYVHEDKVKPATLAWLRSNGYNKKIKSD